MTGLTWASAASHQYKNWLWPLSFYFYRLLKTGGLPHGLQAISGGIAPDLRQLDRDCVIQKDAIKKSACLKEMDSYYVSSVRNGKLRNGAVYMPPFDSIFSQEAVWAIKSYLESVSPGAVAAK
jgi:hypothetical protein